MKRARIRHWAAALLLATVRANASAAANDEVAALLARGDAFDAKLDNAHALEIT